MSSINQVTLVGRLGADAELRHFGERAKISLSVACSERVKKQGEYVEETTWVPVSHWVKSDSKLPQYLTKGGLVAVTGQLKIDKYEKDGEKKSFTFVNARDVRLLGGKSANGGGAAAPSGRGGNYSDADYGPAGDSDDVPF